MLLKRKFLFGTTILAGVVAATAPALAQDQLPGVNVQGQQTQEATQVDEVVITGSRIRRDPTNSPTPLIQVTGEELLTTGQSTVIDYLATIPALSNSLVPSDTTGSGLNDGGLSFANLRSLGTGRTLVLVDGRRHVGAAQGNLAVDVDSIPRLLIENIEIITGGASSVYGADAVSGVLNFNLRRDFEGLEIDANYGMINQDGQANKRISALIGTNLMDDRLNLYGFAEYEDIDMVESLDIDWLEDSRALVGIDADPTNAVNDGMLDNAVFSGLTTLSRPRWGQTTLANSQQPSPLNDPDVPLANCTSLTSANCYSLDPTRTYVYEGPTARLANFGQRIGNVGSNRTLNIGGDGENPSRFGQDSRVPQSTSQRYQVGANFALLDNVDLSVEYKMVEEDTFDIAQPTFFDIFLHETPGTSGANADWTNRIRATSQFDLRYSDNAFLPANVKAAIDANMVQNWTANPTTPGTPSGAPVSRQWARHSMFGPDRTQDNHREVERFVAAINGDFDQFLFVKNINWDLSYTYGEARNQNVERGVDVQRFALAADAVVDVAGAVNGNPGEIVCRAKLIQATGGDLDDYFRGGLLTDSVEGTAALNECVPLNVFGAGNQSPEALEYVDAAITVSHTNEQEQAIAAVSGQLWDFWGAGEIGVAVGAEYRREFTEGVGRSATTGDRLLFLNTGADFLGAEYESEEWFAELSIPLLRDSWLGEYAELSGSYRAFDYTTAGDGDVYGVNFVYRPIQDITFKTSFNTSFRAPNLNENFAPLSQTFANGYVDPCATLNIAAQTVEIRNNRIANCQALLNQYNAANGTALAYDFAGATATNVDDFNPVYGSGIAGVNGGNPLLRPEESESFTFSTVLEPRMFPNLSIVLDYYEIEITDVIASVSAQTMSNLCVNGPTLDPQTCGLLFRNDPTPGREFYLGGPAGDPIGGFIQSSINYAALKTRGLDFTVRYSLDTEEAFGRNWGRFNYSLGGLWLIEQKQFLDPANAASFTELSSNVFFPRVRMTSSLTWVPNDTWSVNWTMDWQTAQDSVRIRDQVQSGNIDTRPFDTYDTGNFARHDFTVRANIRDDLSMRFGVVNAFDAEQPAYLGTTLFSNFDPYGTRFFVGLNYRPF
ncbi:TonB-dependent receptor domain-containing protein [Brevundimonas sp.]|uniref:TonB-dependent receptor domain-containing protein n=1 Tax=Brevundimonas sp. TaxID=1871086 RepID=UPI002ED8BB1F